MSDLYIYNSLSKRKELFVPLNPPQVKMYSCGPTVYGLLHVGNFRGPIFYNLVRNWLEESGYKVTFVYNYTDVDDKIINKAKEEGKKSEEIAEQYIQEFEKDFTSLGLRKHDYNPRVTENMKAIVEMVEELIKKGFAYEVEGEVLFSIQTFEEYGKLSNRKPEGMLTGVRIEVAEKKKSPLDFALWKPSKEGEPFWNSPWGRGRPGWHIECSAMSKVILGEQIDIHGGGMDLIFPHHENEIAQSEACHGKLFAKYWLHNNMLQIDGAKMSKSLGNILYGRTFIENYNAEILKYLILSSHYRSEMDFNDSTIEKAIRELARVYSALNLADLFSSEQVSIKTKAEEWDSYSVKFSEALNDDFNTPEAFAQIFEAIRKFNSQFRRGMKTNPSLQEKADSFKKFIKSCGKSMSLFQETPQDFLKTLDDMLLTKMNLKREDIDNLVNERWLAREKKDFKKSDEMRAELNKMRIAVSDTVEGSFWEVAK